MQDLAKSKSTIATLEASVAASASQLAAVQESLTTAEASLASAAAAPAVTSSADLEDKLAALESQLAASKADMADVQNALKTTQEDAMSNIDAMNKIHDVELQSKEEDHVNSLGLLKKDLTSSKAEIERLRESLEEKAREGVTKEKSMPAIPGEEIAGLHKAHEAKLAEIEEKSKAQIAELEEVRDPLLR